MSPLPRSIPFLALVGLTACASAAPIPIPMYGSRDDIDAIAGEWRGSYRSDETGRSGSISFTLRAGRDTAFGEVVMIPASYNIPLEPMQSRTGEPRPVPSLLAITFVRVGGSRLRGTLDQYLDPNCQCPMRTAFTGSLRGGNTLQGTFESQTTQSPAILRGEWSATRVAKSVAATP